MDRTERNGTDYYTVDLLHILKTLWKKAWLIIMIGLLAAAMGFSWATFGIAPKYSSSIMLYVNNSSFSLGNTSFSISSSEISAAQSLVKTYIVMLENRTTLEKVIQKAGVSYTHEELAKMLEAKAVNETEVLKVTVTTEDPYEAAKIANCIAEVLPVRIAEVIEGASMEVVDSGVVNLQKVSPSITKYTAVGFLLGVLLMILLLTITAIMDDTIHDEEYVLRNYDCPVLAKIPDLLNSGGKHYGYYYQHKSKAKE
jgi:capsular polysaccharide biosynthesis protein